MHLQNRLTTGVSQRRVLNFPCHTKSCFFFNETKIHQHHSVSVLELHREGCRSTWKMLSAGNRRSRCLLHQMTASNLSVSAADFLVTQIRYRRTQLWRHCLVCREVLCREKLFVPLYNQSQSHVLYKMKSNPTSMPNEQQFKSPRGQGAVFLRPRLNPKIKRSFTVSSECFLQPSRNLACDSMPPWCFPVLCCWFYEREREIHGTQIQSGKFIT